MRKILGRLCWVLLLLRMRHDDDSILWLIDHLMVLRWQSYYWYSLRFSDRKSWHSLKMLMILVNMRRSRRYDSLINTMVNRYLIWLLSLYAINWIYYLTICRITKFNCLVGLGFGLNANILLKRILGKRRITYKLCGILRSMVWFYLLLLIEELPLKILTISRGGNDLMILKY